MSGSSKEKLPKVVVVVGPTASGKSSLAMLMAKKFNGEIISADSRTIYKGMDIGTAKASIADQKKIPHHLLDVVEPTDTLTLASYKQMALRSIQDVLGRGKLPVIVGGTGLYVQSLIDNLDIPKVAPIDDHRKELEDLSKDELFSRLEELDPEYAKRIGPNPRYAIRALEVIKSTGKPFSQLQKKGKPLFNEIIIGMQIEKDELEERINTRVDQMIENGLLDEIRGLKEKYPETLPAMSGIGYKEFFGHLNGTETLQEAVKLVKIHTRQYAKRQMTWFKRDKRINWFKVKSEAVKAIQIWLI